MKRAFVFYLVFGIIHVSFSQVWEGIPGGAVSGSGMISTQSGTAWAVTLNPAGLSNAKTYSLGVFYSDRFRLKELSTKNISAVIPVGRNAFGLSYSLFGSSVYSEQRASLGYGLELFNGIHAGVSLDYCWIQQGGGYGSASAMTFGAGLQYALSQDITLGVYSFNPIRSAFNSNTSARLPSGISIGLKGTISTQLVCGFELQKEWDTSPGLRTGFEYEISEWIFVQGGLGINPGIWSAGAGFKYRGMRLDISSQWHPVLGISSAASINFNL